MTAAKEANAAIAPGERGFGRGGPGGGRGFGRRDSGPRNIYQFNVLCLDRNTGEIIWEKTAREAAPHEGMHDTNSYASGSPTTDGKFIYASFGSHGVYCYDLDGKLIWEKDLGDMETRNGFGEGASPTIYGDTLLVPWDHEKDSHLFALDAKTGEVKWQIDRDEPTTWVTPLVIEAAGKTQVILNGTNRSRSYDINTGEVIWECGGQVTNPISTAIQYEDLVYCMTGHRGSAVVAIPLDATGDITDTDKIAWKTNQGAPYVPSPLLYGDKLYFTKGTNGVLSCLEAKTGEPLIDQKRLAGVENIYASPSAPTARSTSPAATARRWSSPTRANSTSSPPTRSANQSTPPPRSPATKSSSAAINTCFASRNKASTHRRYPLKRPLITNQAHLAPPARGGFAKT